jgi:hypothetical protein
MKDLVVKTSRGLVRVNLIENSFTIKWQPVYQRWIDQYRQELREGPKIGQYMGAGSSYIEKKADVLIKVIAELTDICGYFPYEVTVDTLLKQDLSAQVLLNNIHRAFTTSNRCIFCKESKKVWNDRSGLAFTIADEHRERFLYLTELLNANVHYLEFFMKTPRKKENLDDLYQQLEIYSLTANSNPYDDMGPYHTLEDFYVEYDDNDYACFSDDGTYDVWVGRDILGKDFYHAYYDHDDPSNWDVTGQIAWSTKIAFDIGPTKKSQIIKSQDFNDWLTGYGVEYSKRMGGMPLGRVIEGRDILESYKNTNQPFTDVEIYFD